MKSTKVKQEVLGLAIQIVQKKNELERLNKQVEKRQDKFYLLQIEDMPSGKEATDVIYTIAKLINGENGIRKQNEKMQSLMNTLITKLSSKTINTHMSIMSKYGSTSNAIVYNKGFGRKEQFENTRRVSVWYDIFEMLYQHGREIAEYIPSQPKQDIVNIFTKYAKMGKFKMVPILEKKMLKINKKSFDFLDTDIESNYMITKKKIKEVGFEIVTRMFTQLRIHVKTDIYSEDIIRLHLSISPYDMYLIATLWDKIGKDMIKIKDDLIKLHYEREDCLSRLTYDLSPYLLARTL